MEYLDDAWIVENSSKLLPNMLSQFDCVYYKVFLPVRDLHQAHETLVASLRVVLQINRDLFATLKLLLHLNQLLKCFYIC